MGGKKAGGGFLGIGGKQGFLNTGLFSTGPQQISGFQMSPQAIQAEQEMIARQNAIANGTAPSYSQMAFNKNLDATNRAGMALAASQRGASNPALAFRQAQLQTQQANLEGAQTGAMMAEQERRNADQLIAAQAAAQRGVAFQQANTNLNATLQNQQNQMNAISGMAQTGAKVATSGGNGKWKGGVIEGQAQVPGDSPENDTVPTMLSPGEIVVPRSAVKNEKTLKAFIDKVKAEQKEKKKSEK